SRYCSEKLATIRGTRAIVLDALARIDEICVTPKTEGALYVFIKLRTHLHPMQVVEKLITQHRVAVIPGTTFGMECGCYLRVSFGALDPDTAREGAARLVTGLQAIVAGH
ncbi:MAG: aminotransferase class I/II-fold pyridoxal phosphate-dependent enzyme, partial [Gammaproteobacteria bacterium]